MATIPEAVETVNFDQALCAPARFAALCQEDIRTLQALHPVLAEALSRAAVILREGLLFPEEDGRSAMVWSTDRARVYHVNGACECPDSHYREGVCKHRLALRVYQRVCEALAHESERWTLTEAPAASPAIAPQHLCEIQGKQYVKYAGLLQMAHERGLVSLTAAWIFNDADLSLAHAVATFQDGKRFEESGDATPANTNRKVAVHFRRVALTRAKARVLRDALGCDFVALEELGETGEGTA
jgi:hypothetical protein